MKCSYCEGEGHTKAGCPFLKQETVEILCLKCNRPFQSVCKTTNRVCRKCNYRNSRINSTMTKVLTRSTPTEDS